MDYAKEYDRMVEQSNRQQVQIEELRKYLSDAMEWNWLDADIENCVDVKDFERVVKGD